MEDPFVPGPVESDPFTTAYSVFNTIFVIAVVLIAIGFVTVIVLIVRNARRARQAGHDPLTLQTDLAVRALDSEMLAPRQTLEERLAELDELAARGVITGEERAAARTELLAGR